MWILEYFVVYVLCISSAGYVELPIWYIYFDAWYITCCLGISVESAGGV